MKTQREAGKKGRREGGKEGGREDDVPCARIWREPTVPFLRERRQERA